MHTGRVVQVDSVGQHGHCAGSAGLKSQGTEHPEVLVFRNAGATTAGEVERPFEKVIARIAGRAEPQLPAGVHRVVAHVVRCDGRLGEGQYALLDRDVPRECLACPGDPRHAGTALDHRARAGHQTLQT